MAFKLVIAVAIFSVANAGLHQAPQTYQHVPQTFSIAQAQPIYAKAQESYDPHPKYQFSYAVQDEHTGDVKSQREARDGDLVQGEYSLIDSDGYKRTVQYTADHEHGFNAVVQREPLGHAAPAAYAAPTHVKSAPIVYRSAPVAYKAAPVIYKSAPVPVAYAAAPATQYSHVPASYTSQPVVVSTAPGYAAAQVLKYTQAAPPTYGAPTIFRSVPVSYAAPPLYSQSSAKPATQSIARAVSASYADGQTQTYSYKH